MTKLLILLGILIVVAYILWDVSEFLTSTSSDGFIRNIIFFFLLIIFLVVVFIKWLNGKKSQEKKRTKNIVESILYYDLDPPKFLEEVGKLRQNKHFSLKDELYINYQQALGHYSNGELDKAKKLWKSLLKGKSHEFTGASYYHISKCCFLDKDFDQGNHYKKIFEKYTDDTKENAENAVYKKTLDAIINYIEGHYEASLGTYSEILQSRNNIWDRLNDKFILAQIHEKTGDEENQAKYLEDIIVTGKKLYIRKIAHEKLLQLAGNRNVSSEIIELEKILYDDLDPHRYIEKAIAVNGTIELSKPLKYQHMYELSNAYANNGEVKKSIELQEELLLLARAEQLIDVYFNLAIRYLIAGNADEAYKYRDLYEKKSGHKSPSFMLSWFLFVEAKYTESLEVLEKSLENGIPLYSQIIVNYRMAKCYEKLGDKKKQRHHLQHVVENGNKLYVAKIAREKLKKPHTHL